MAIGLFLHPCVRVHGPMTRDLSTDQVFILSRLGPHQDPSSELAQTPSIKASVDRPRTKQPGNSSSSCRIRAQYSWARPACGDEITATVPARMTKGVTQ